MSVRKLAVLSMLLWAAPASAPAADRILRTEMLMPAPIAEVWAAWTTEAGVMSFFAPGCRLEPRVDGAYEIYFDPQGRPGRRGADDMRILAFEPQKRLAFTWNAPWDQPYARAQRTVVEIRLRPVDATRTRLLFTHSGWGEGPEWDAAYRYFDVAWNAHVLPRLQRRFTHGPVDWSRVPKLEPVARSLQVELSAR
jgi:uncharacterized protein YndB with AHSA1/START domain